MDEQRRALDAAARYIKYTSDGPDISFHLEQLKHAFREAGLMDEQRLAEIEQDARENPFYSMCGDRDYGPCRHHDMLYDLLAEVRRLREQQAALSQPRTRAEFDAFFTPRGEG